MTATLTIDHRTTYRYARPVTFGEHRFLFRPRGGHDIRVLTAELSVKPKADVRWVQDVFSNWVAVFTPRGESDHLEIAAHIRIIHGGTTNIALPLASHAQRYPFDYTPEERRDLGALLDPHYPDPEGRLYAWNRAFLAIEPRPETMTLLMRVAQAIQSGFTYIEREQEGTQPPGETLTRSSGSCRDFALLMIEALRRLGFAARFVSGYLYDPALDCADDDSSESDLRGAGATHAWLQVYLPGAGWVAFDPTNATSGGASLVRVAFARDPSQAPPLTGAWFGESGDNLGMTVDVEVCRHGMRLPLGT